jgi:Na+-driven multidrug efflux pump
MPPFGPYEDVNTTLPMTLSVICMSLCCMPGGAIGLVLASQASSAKGVGDFDRAKTKARASILVSAISMGITLVFGTLYLLLAIVSDAH